MPAGRVHEPPDDRQKLVKLINSRDTAIGRRAACFVDRLDLGICSVDERRIGVGGLISLLALCVGVLCCRGVVFGVLCFSPLSRGVSRAPKLPEVGEYSYREKFVARGGGNVGGNGGGGGHAARGPTNPNPVRPAEPTHLSQTNYLSTHSPQYYS